MVGSIQFSEFNLEGYNVFCQGLNENESRGLLVYVAYHLEATLVDVPDAFNESLFLMIKCPQTANRLLFDNCVLLGLWYMFDNIYCGICLTTYTAVQAVHSLMTTICMS